MFCFKYKTDINLYKHYVNKVLCRRIFLIGFILLLFGMLTLILCLNNKVFMMLDILFLLIVLFIMILIPKLMFNELMSLNDNGDINIELNEDYIVSNVDSIDTEIRYSDIVRIYEDKDMFCLMLDRGNGIILLKCGLIKGKLKDLYNFLISNCINVKKIIKL